MRMAPAPLTPEYLVPCVSHEPQTDGRGAGVKIAAGSWQAAANTQQGGWGAPASGRGGERVIGSTGRRGKGKRRGARNYFSVRSTTSGDALRRTGVQAVPMPRVTYRWDALRR